MIISNLVYIYYLQYIIKLLIYSIYKKYFESDIFEAERIRVEKEVRIHALLRDGKWKEAKNVL